MRLKALASGSKGYDFFTSGGQLIATGEYSKDGFEMIYGETVTTWKNAMMAFSYLNKIV